MPRRKVIGVFMAQLSDAYQSAVWEGIERRVQELGLGVVWAESAGAELSIEDLEPGTRICCRIPHAVEG